jgi:hypothetical protein
MVLFVQFAVLLILAAVVGFALGAALHRRVFGDQLLDLDGDVQTLRARVAEAKGSTEAG